MEHTQPTSESSNGMAETPITDIHSGVWSYIGSHPAYIIMYAFYAFGSMYIFPNLFNIVIVVIAGLVCYALIYQKVKTEFTQEFGKSIGFVYSKSMGLDTVSGKLFQTGHSQRLFDVLSGMYKDLLMRIFSLRFTVGSGKSSHTYSYTVFEATLKNPAPSILLYSKSHEGAVSDWLSGNETIELEGDFNEYFRLRVPQGDEQTAYEIFTPDVMADLIDRASDMSFEFAGDKLYAYATKIITKREELQNTLDTVVYVVGLFNKNLG